MSDQDEGAARLNVGGGIEGSQIAVGSQITQTWTVVGTAASLTDGERAELAGLFSDLRTEVEKVAPPEVRGPAVERVTELEEELTAEKPDPGVISYLRQWFVKRLPQVAGVVTSVLVHPIVGKLVQAAGEAAAGQVRERFGD